MSFSIPMAASMFFVGAYYSIEKTAKYSCVHSQEKEASCLLSIPAKRIGQLVKKME